MSACCLVLAAVAAISLVAGAVKVDGAAFGDVLAGRHSVGAYVLAQLRAPRIAAAMLVGGTLGVSGAILQTFLRNALADPYLTGASGGAALAVAATIALGGPVALYAPIAFAAALLATAIAFVVSRSGVGDSPQRLILAGIAISSLCGSLTTLVILIAPRATASLSILAWLGGSVGGHGWPDVVWAYGYACAAIVPVVAIMRPLNAMRIGRDRAVAVGVDLARTERLVLTASSLLTGAAVSISGIIGFVGLIVPHVARAVVGNDVRWTIAASIPIGATLVCSADLLARTILPPIEFPLGVLLSLLGVPAFLAIVSRRREAA